MKRVFGLFLAVAMVLVSIFAFAGCGAKTTSDVEKVKNAGYLNVGITVYPPMDYQDDDEEWIGFDADLANLFAKELGVRARFTVIKWDSKIMELNSGYIDLIWNGMTASDDLEKEIDLTIPYATNMQCVVVKKAALGSINTADDVKGLKIAVEGGSAGDTTCVDTLGVTPIRVTAQVDAISEVVAGTSDACIIDYTLAYNVVGKGDNADLAIVDIEKVSFDQEEFAIGARTDSDLVAAINKFLKEKYADGTLTALAEKYSVAIDDAKLK
ncbi:MAG: transporter substrate-binding domain-containing protein [Clostridia bacterium]|nr:transporter substrate-binding domain-containing protein [Clostridia bacterium]